MPKIKYLKLEEGTYDSDDDDDDFDDWGSDFEDSDEEVEEQQSLEVNNNSIHSAPESEIKSSDSSSNPAISQEKCIPKPPDIPIVPKAANTSTIFRSSNQSNGVPRPPLKRPPSQPPPPPVPQFHSQEEPQEDYEIPIASSSSSCSSSGKNAVIETYELVDGQEENYEIVDPPPLLTMSEKPILPPRYLKSPESVSPPPLPQKPLKLKEALLGQDGVKTFCRPKLPVKSSEFNEGQAESSCSSSSASHNNVSFISSLMGRRPSLTSNSSPKTQHKEGAEVASSPPNLKFLNGSQTSLSSSSSEKDELKKSVPLPPLPPRGTADEIAQNMATRPLPPVPITKVEEKPSEVIQEIQSYPWFHEIEREEAEGAVRDLGVPGSFVVRPSKRAGKDNPYSLTVLHESRLFHLNVRLRQDGTFALGKEKEKEKTFSTVAELITYHQNEPILLKNRGEPAGKTKLCKYPEKS